jgi:POT family proton-dependent oligopeptide transporter
MVAGASLVGLSYLLLAALAESYSSPVGWPWAALFVLLMTAGELWILPVGLGLFGRLAPAGMSATAIALWFSAGFLGNLLAAWLGGKWSAMSHAAFFLVVGAVALAAAILLATLISRGRTIEGDVGHPV